MATQASIDPADYEWRPYSILLPRIGLMLSRDGTRTRIIMPGSYRARRSRTLGRWIYQRDTSDA